MREAVSANDSPGAPGTSGAVGGGAQLTMGPVGPGAPGDGDALGLGGGGGTSQGGVPIGPGVSSSISASPRRLSRPIVVAWMARPGHRNAASPNACHLMGTHLPRPD